MKKDFLEKKMDEFCEKWLDQLHSLDALPSPNGHGSVTIQYQKLRELIKQRGKLSFYDGFFYGVACSGIYLGENRDK